MPLKGKNVRVRGPWWHYQFEANGEVYSGNTRLEGVASNQSAAESFAERLRQEKLRPKPALAVIESESDRRRKPFDLAAADFHVWARGVEYRDKPSTAQRLKTSMVSCVAYFGGVAVSDIQPEHLEGYKRFRIEEYRVRDITLRHDLHALSVFFRYAIKRGWARVNPVREIKIPSDRDAVREHVLTAEEESKYLTAVRALHGEWLNSRPKERRDLLRPNLHDLAILMLEQGCRPEEILALKQEHVNLEAGTMRIAGGKTRAAKRLLSLTGRSREVLAPRLDGGPWVFPSERRPGRHVTKLQNTHDRACIEAGVSFVLYDLRHTFATRMIHAGNDVPTVAAILGHSGLRTIYRYVHPTAEAQRAAMERYEAAQMRSKLKAV